MLHYNKEMKSLYYYIILGYEAIILLNYNCEMKSLYSYITTKRWSHYTTTLQGDEVIILLHYNKESKSFYCYITTRRWSHYTATLQQGDEIIILLNCVFNYSLIFFPSVTVIIIGNGISNSILEPIQSSLCVKWCKCPQGRHEFICSLSS